MIKIPVRDITLKGVDVDRVVPIEGIDLSNEEVDVASGFNIHAHLSRTEDIVVAETTLKADFGYLCARCLEVSYKSEERHFYFEFVLEPGQEYVDLGEEIRQEIIMANPPRVLCKKDCLGICAKCGTNLNIASCECQ